MTVSKTIREKRNTARMTQAELAYKVGVSDKTVQRWESGERVPGADDLLKLADALNVPVSYLFGEDDEGNLQVGNVHVTGSISEAIVNGSGIVIVRNGREQVLSDELSELVRLYEMFDVKRRTTLLSKAFELESEKQRDKD